MKNTRKNSHIFKSRTVFNNRNTLFSAIMLAGIVGTIGIVLLKSLVTIAYNSEVDTDWMPSISLKGTNTSNVQKTVVPTKTASLKTTTVR